jgi:hypothetical protein
MFPRKCGAGRGGGPVPGNLFQNREKMTRQSL